MKSPKFDESKAPINIDEDRQTHSHEDLEADESYESEAELEQDPSPSTSMIVKKSKSLVSRIFSFIRTLIEYSALAAVFMLCQALSANYFEINQVCPYDNDFECYYRYLLCEGDCNPSKPLYKQGFDFVVEPRKHEFLFDTRLADIITRLLVISVIYALILAFGILKKGARLYPVIVAINVAYLRTYRDGEDHGDYSKILGTWLVILVSGLGLLFTGTVLLARLNSKGKMYAWTVYGGIMLLLGSVVVGLGYRFFDSCGNWDKGLYGESMDNDVNCEFSKPTVCLYEFFGDAYDYNRWLLFSPKDRKPHWNLMTEKYVNATKIGFPMMVSATKDDRLPQNVQNYVSSNIREVTETNEKNYEVVLHRTYDDKTDTYRDPAWIDINIQFNKELVEQRSPLVSKSIADNVIVIYLDSLSRAGAFRQLPETMKLFENMAPKVHQFFKYHSATPTTLGNMYPLFYGISEPFKPNVPKKGVTTSFLRDFKEKGFVTGRALSSCVTSTMAGANFYYIDDEPFDHIGNGWACDVNAIGKDPEESTTGPLSMLRRSVYGKEMSEYVIDYGKKFLDTYKSQKKLLWLDFLDFHDFTFSQGKYLDGHLSKFLSEMDLSQTMLMLVSDNGQNLFKHELFSFFRSTEIEKAAPALFVKLPKSAENEYGSGLENNKQQLVQGYDVNKLLRAIPNPETASQTMLHKLPEKTKGCDFPVLDQECQCTLPSKK